MPRMPSASVATRAEDASGLTPARFGDSAKARAGDVVLAVGSPLGLSGSVTEGIISATGRSVTQPATGSSPGATLAGAIQTSAPINSGNSGGALVNTAGEVIGVPALAAASPATGAQAQGIGFAIPASQARDIAGQLITTGHATSARQAALDARQAALDARQAALDARLTARLHLAATSTAPGLHDGLVVSKDRRTPCPER